MEEEGGWGWLWILFGGWGGLDLWVLFGGYSIVGFSYLLLYCFLLLKTVVHLVAWKHMSVEFLPALFLLPVE